MRQPTASHIFERLNNIEQLLVRNYRLRARDHQLLVAIVRAQNLLTELQVIELEMENDQMATVVEVKARLDAVQAAVAGNTDATSALSTAFTGLKAEVVTANQALADYIASHPDDAELDAIAASLDTIIASVDADTLAEKVLAGTEVVPPVEPGV